MSTLWFALLLTAVVFGFILVIRRYPSITKYTKFFVWVADTVRITVDHWGFNKRYSQGALLSSHLFSLARVAALSKDDMARAKRRVSEFVSVSYRLFYPEGSWTDDDERISAAAYLALIHHPEIKELVLHLTRSHEDLEVKKATYLAIDVVGELVDLTDDLGQEYFQHLIYGINKSLVLIKKNGTNKKNLKKVVGVLFRVYKLTKAYHQRRGLKNLTESELYEKVKRIFDYLPDELP